MPHPSAECRRLHICTGAEASRACSSSRRRRMAAARVCSSRHGSRKVRERSTARQRRPMVDRLQLARSRRLNDAHIPRAPLAWPKLSEFRGRGRRVENLQEGPEILATSESRPGRPLGLVTSDRGHLNTPTPRNPRAKKLRPTYGCQPGRPGLSTPPAPAHQVRRGPRR